MPDIADTSAQDTGLDAAAKAFEQILAREDGQPEQPKKQQRAEAPAEQAEAAVDDEADETPDEEEAEEAEAEDDAAEEDDDAEDDGEDGDDDAELPQKVTVKIDGKTEEVPLDEVIKGYQRQADYSRKTEALARERAAFQEEAQQVQVERQQYATLLTALEQQLTELQQPEVDWDRLWQENPNEWVRQRTLLGEREKKIEAARFERDRLMALQATEQQRAMAQHVEAQRAVLTELVPEARDKAKWEGLRPKIREYAQKLGYSPEEIAQAYDARAVAVMVKAMKYDELLAKKPKPVPPRAVQTVQEHRAKPPRATTQLTRDKQRLAKTGSVRDAAKVFEGLI